jgi:hypothetical protein
MASIMALLLGAALQAQPADLATYRDRALGLSFQHPKAWTVERGRLFTTFSLPIEEGASAQAQLFGAVFRDRAENWQSLQAEINQAQGRTIERQWQEELLGVPMLLTRVAYSEGEQARVLVIGLLYSATAAIADRAQQQWWEAMLTLRTLSGQLPGEEDPSKPLEDLAPREPQPVIVLRKPAAEATTVRGPVRVAAEGMTLSLPEGWRLEGGTLQVEGLRGRLRISVGEGAGQVAGDALERAASESMAAFATVELRKDQVGAPAQSGALVASVWRRGKGKDGPLVRADYVGLCGDVHWMIRYEAAGLADWNADRSRIAALTAQTFVER